MNLNGLHYHNSLKTTDQAFSKYRPTTEIISEPLTNKYSIGEQIGRGKFAVVKKCINHETKEVVAAKFIKKRRRGKTCRDEILREVVMLEMALDHPRLVDLKEVYETATELILITEYCAGGELFTECILDEKFSESDVRLLMTQILEGLVYLHEKCIVHLDLKPQNILLTEPFPRGTVKICDLGFACLVNTGEDIRDIIGTPDYVAPEVLNYDPLGLYTDMWSLGVLTYVMLTQCSPFAGDDKQMTFCNITTVQLDFPEDLFSEISDEAQDFIKKLLIAIPEERMTAKECLQHPWIAGSLSPSSGLSTVVASASGSLISDSNHSMLDNETKSVIDTSDSNCKDSLNSKMVSCDSDSSENQTEQSKTIELTSDKNFPDFQSEELEVIPEMDSEVLNRRQDSELPNRTGSTDELKHSELSQRLHENENEVEMDVKSESSSNTELSGSKMQVSHSKIEPMHSDLELSYSNMDVSFTKEDLGKGNSDRTEENICETKNTKGQNIFNFDNEDTIMSNRSASENETGHIDGQNISSLHNMSKIFKSVEIVVRNEDQDTEMSSPGVIEIGLKDVSKSDSKTGWEKFDNCNKPVLGSEENENLADSNVKVSENPHKRGMCNDTSASLLSPTSGSETVDEIQYEFISVSKRVKNYEEALSPQKSPQISPKSPRSPRVSRFQRRSNHHNTPKSS